MNGLDLNATEAETFDLVIRVARGEADKSQVIDFFKTHIAR